MNTNVHINIHVNYRTLRERRQVCYFVPMCVLIMLSSFLLLHFVATFLLQRQPYFFSDNSNTTWTLLWTVTGYFLSSPDNDSFLHWMNENDLSDRDSRESYLAVSCTPLHYLALLCTILHYLSLSCTILHCLKLSCTVLHYLALSCTI